MVASSPRFGCAGAARTTRPSRFCCYATSSRSCSVNSQRPGNVPGRTGPTARLSHCCSGSSPGHTAPDCACSSAQIGSCAGIATCCAPAGRRSLARRTAVRPHTATSRLWFYVWPGTIRHGATSGSMASWQGSASPSQPPPSERSSRMAASTRRPDAVRSPGRASCDLKPKASWPATSSPPISWTARRSTSWLLSSMPAAGSASWATRFIRPAS